MDQAAWKGDAPTDASLLMNLSALAEIPSPDDIA
jgi:hypothetical protein